jgi:hypothetical protein
VNTRLPSWLRGPLLAVATVVLLALVVLAAAGHRLGSGRGGGAPSPTVRDTLLSLLFAGWVMVAILVVAFFFWGGYARRVAIVRGVAPKRQRTTIPLLVTLLVLGVLLVTAHPHRGFLHFLHLHRSHSAATATAHNPKTKHGGADRARSPEPRLRLLPFLLAIGAVLGVGGAVAVANRRRLGRVPWTDLGVAQALTEVVDETLDDLHAEADPRRAVIAAYARMERVLGAYGVPRRPAEAPHEYLARVVGELTDVRGSAGRLTTLFERARFSTHAVDPSMKDDAIAAFEALREQLRPPPRPEPVPA